MPVVGETAAMADVVSMITAKGFGCAVVVDADGKLTGVVTDGDLRRKLGAGWGGRLARDVMTRDPHRIAPDALTALEVRFGARLPFGAPALGTPLTLHCPDKAVFALVEHLDGLGADDVTVSAPAYVFRRANRLLERLDARI